MKMLRLPRYLWVPSGLLDHDLKRTFAHFRERRVPRLCWHRPGGGHLLRGAAFHPASEPGAEDVRCLEALLLGGRGPCVVADAAELPSLADIQLAHLKLRALCLPGAVAEDKWLSALEGTRWLEHVRTCLRRAVEVATLLAGARCSVLLQAPAGGHPPHPHPFPPGGMHHPGMPPMQVHHGPPGMGQHHPGPPGSAGQPPPRPPPGMPHPGPPPMGMPPRGPHFGSPMGHPGPMPHHGMRGPPPLMPPHGYNGPPRPPPYGYQRVPLPPRPAQRPPGVPPRGPLRGPLP
ncbi:hypothetical protein AV530_009222 [Patagioenas fasciata monilis]|uniref:Myotubularin phosphatase domain-containing protein n=1 Tax=Patagioenas fasciata monilis TaxID=372326 RepID=A0A1V4KMJ8_PATFA|nr:hypothetical protein AV530_009222 [Patagioenas fasciata monilis]